MPPGQYVFELCFSLVTVSVPSLTVIYHQYVVYWVKPVLLNVTCVFCGVTADVSANVYVPFSDVLVYIPGGLGTLDELMSAIETKRGEEHNLPIIIVNQNGYFNDFLNMLEKVYAEEFSSDSAKNLYKVVNNSKELFEEVEALRK